MKVPAQYVVPLALVKAMPASHQGMENYLFRSPPLATAYPMARSLALAPPRGVGQQPESKLASTRLARLNFAALPLTVLAQLNANVSSPHPHQNHHTLHKTNGFVGPFLSTFSPVQ